ncbi:hypothetical protein [Microcoleus sp. B9-D4]|uniref:hypothetical protein n=1 Tax=Microcoleus sp. B9-D4 TaxID=2818711 RepID=UPI002FCF0769
MPNSQFPIEARRKKEEGREGDRENSLFCQCPVPNSQFPVLLIPDSQFPIPDSQI